MILTSKEIEKEVNQGKIKISPFQSSNLSTNSYDVSMGNQLLKYTAPYLDPHKENAYEMIDIPDEGYYMNAGDFLLSSTQEKIGSDFFVPIIHGRSSTARMGLFIHVTADLFDIGYYGNSTLQLYATAPIILHPFMKIAQVSFWMPEGDITLYSGKYQHSASPTPSRIHKDFVTI